jgi:rhamnosyl/mannosyltransferase
MRILHLAKFYHPYRGGIEKVIKELSEAAVQQGHDVTVICANERNERVEETISGVRVIRLPRWTSIFSQPVTPSVFSEVGEWFKKVDVVHLHTPNPLFESACLVHEIPCPLVVTYHCEVMKARTLNNIYKPMSRAVLKKASRILVATPYHIEFSKVLREFENKCEVIPFGIEPKYDVKNLEINNHLNVIKKKFDRYFLFIGRMVPYKGLPILLEAMKSVDQNLVLIGKGPQLEPMRELSRKMGVEDRVHFLGAVESDAEFAAYMHGSDAVVLPSINEAEAFGLALLEAMSCKKPVITTDLKSGVRFVNLAGVTGLMVPPSDAPALAKAMNLMATDDDLRLRLGTAAHKHFKEKFLVSESFSRHFAAYSGVSKPGLTKSA